MKTIKELQREAYEIAKSKGWHEKRVEFGTLIALMHSELSEALEADRKNLGIDKVAEELADVCIRVFDTCEALDIDLEEAILKKMEYNRSRETSMAVRNID